MIRSLFFHCTPAHLSRDSCRPQDPWAKHLLALAHRQLKQDHQQKDLAADWSISVVFEAREGTLSTTVSKIYPPCAAPASISCGKHRCHGSQPKARHHFHTSREDDLVTKQSHPSHRC